MRVRFRTLLFSAALAVAAVSHVSAAWDVDCLVDQSGQAMLAAAADAPGLRGTVSPDTSLEAKSIEMSFEGAAVDHDTTTASTEIVIQLPQDVSSEIATDLARMTPPEFATETVAIAVANPANDEVASTGSLAVAPDLVSVIGEPAESAAAMAIE